jgi:hypothetical protein
VIGLLSHRTIAGSSTQTHQSSAIGESETVPSVTVRQLTKEIVSIEEGVPVENATGEEYHNVYTALIQTHLPKLDDAGAIQYDDDRKEVAPDRNLIPLAIATAILSPVAQMLFHSAVANLYTGDTSSLDNSISD